MQLVFLGTGSHYPTKERGVSCTALRHVDGSVWLFDCGEGTQVQLQKSSLRPGKINKIFITHLHGDHLFGLPGLLCSIGAWNPDKTDQLEIYGPVGLRQYIRTCLQVSYCVLEYTFQVHELEVLPSQTPLQWKDWAQSVSNSEQCMAQEKPGRNIKPDQSETWHLFEDSKVTVSAGWIHHKVPCFGFVVQEKPLPGKLDVVKLKELGVPPGPLYSKLKEGLNIVTDDGKMIDSKDVVEQERPGRKVSILGDTSDPSPMTEIVMDSDVLVHEATLENLFREKALDNGHSTPELAAQFANRTCSRMLILNHFSQRYGPLDDLGDDDASSDSSQKEKKKSAAVLLKEAQKAVTGDCVVLASEDFKEFNILLRDLKISI